MTNAFLRWAAGLAITVSQVVHATPITNTVIVGGQEWAQVTLFTNNSWFDVNTQCPAGLCSNSSSLNGYDLAGWTWASIEEVQGLFNSFTGNSRADPHYFSEHDSTWAPSFLSTFHSTRNVFGRGWTVEGWTSTAVGSGYHFYLMGLMDGEGEFGDATVVEPHESTDFPPGSGVWMSRPHADVPSPATLSLIGLGLASIGIIMRTRARRN